MVENNEMWRAVRFVPVLQLLPIALKNRRMAHFSLQDKRHFEAAQGWLGLGNWQEANEELEKITPQLKAHPEVLALRIGIFGRAGKWEYAVEIARTLSDLLLANPFGPFHLPPRCER